MKILEEKLELKLKNKKSYEGMVTQITKTESDSLGNCLKAVAEVKIGLEIVSKKSLLTMGSSIYKQITKQKVELVM
jgi:DNA helicase TIP49 (TBP-interacting protein)